MPIPDFQSLMRPLLKHLDDGKEHGNRETVEAMASAFSLSPGEVEELLPNGKQSVFKNRIAWAKLHLMGAGLIDSPGRGLYRITARGLNVLDRHDGPINLRVLKQFPEYVEFRTPNRTTKVQDSSALVATQESDLTPEELIDAGYAQVRARLAREILERVRQCPPEFFEALVVELLVAMGYGGSRADAGRAVGRGGDGGIDGIIKEDRLGLDTIYIQAKRWTDSVGRPEIQKFAGALQGVRAKKGIFITSSTFTPDAQSYANAIETRIILIDGAMLAGLMIDNDVGVTRVQSYDIKRLDSDYFATDD